MELVFLNNWLESTKSTFYKYLHVWEYY